MGGIMPATFAFAAAPAPGAMLSRPESEPDLTGTVR
jgi:hypothetical protein